MKKIILNIVLSYLPNLIVEFYDDSLKQQIKEWVDSTENNLDNSFAMALDGFINVLRKQ